MIKRFFEEAREVGVKNNFYLVEGGGKTFFHTASGGVNNFFHTFFKVRNRLHTFILQPP